MPSSKTGLWLIGAYGDIASTLVVGALALRGGLVPPTGLATETPPFNQLGLLPFGDIVFGGHDIVPGSAASAARQVCERSRSFSPRILDAVAAGLDAMDRDIVCDPRFAWEPGAAAGGASLDELGATLRGWLRAFAARHSLSHVVVVNLASAEAYVPLEDGHRDPAAFEALLAADDKARVSPSMLCAHAAFLEGCSFVNFTANPGASIPALQAMAEQKGLPHCGNDGKTGETLLKTALAPMFAMRNLKVLSWEGFNLLGNNDGKVLNLPEHRKNKVKNKEGVLEGILGYPVHADVGISYVPSLGDWKTAWDLIHFQGFLDVPMTMQFTWQGCDSILAAPLVLDLARLAEFAFRHGEGGVMRHAACFFKNPQGVAEHALPRQFELLLSYAARHLGHE